MKHLGVSVFMLLLGLAGCTEQNLQPQASAQSAAPAAESPPPPPVHNLSRVAEAKPVTPEMLASIVVGKTTIAQLVELLGDIKPFTLGDGKKIYRYDLGKFIFAADAVLLRKHINP